MKPRVGDIVAIDWLDSQSIRMGWAPVSEYVEAAKRPQSYHTAGYWLGKHAGHALVTISVDVPNRHVWQAATIPMVAIVKLRVLSRASKATRKALQP